jgi:hypothetical protein
MRTLKLIPPKFVDSGPVLEKIGRVVVSDLSLGKSGLNKTLLHRITDIQLIGSEKPNSP